MSTFRRKLMMAYATNTGKDNIIYPGLIAAWSAAGKTNDDADRATLKDLTGNGHDITLNGFAFSKMSGYGGYNYQFDKSYYMVTSSASYTKTNNKIIITAKDNIDLRVTKSDSVYTWNEYRISIKGLLEGDYIDIYGYYDNTKASAFKINNNGIYIIPKSSKTDGLSGGYDSFIKGIVTKPTTIEIEIIPEYPDALVFDGIDDYGITNIINSFNNGITIIGKRKYLNGVDSTKQQGFSAMADEDIKNIITFETTTGGLNGWLISYYGQVNFIRDKIEKRDISFVNTQTYNGIVNLIKGSSTPKENKYFRIGRTNDDSNARYTKLAFYSIYIFDRTLDEQEIKSFIRKYIDPEYLLPSEEIPTPDCYYDFSQGSNDDENRETIKDYSGNGNDAVAHNFAWSGMSGYGGYNTDFTQWVDSNRGTLIKETFKITITNITQANKAIIYTSSGLRKNMKIRVTGLKDEESLYFGFDGVSDLSTASVLYVNKDGIYDADFSKTSYNAQCIIPTFTGECNITIELLPEYEGALVFDGVDDYVSLDAFDSGFKTMFMVCNQKKNCWCNII